MRKAIDRAAVISLVFAMACAPRATPDKPTLSSAETEAGLAKMFTDEGGKASFTCLAGDDRNEYICEGSYVPFDRSQPTVKQRLGVSVSHYEEGKPVFAIRVVRKNPSDR